MTGAVVYGTLVADPVQHRTRDGQPNVTTSIRVSAGEEALVVGVGAFDETATRRPTQARKGGMVAACVVLEQSTWTGKVGESRTGWRLTGNEVMTAYSATRKRRSAEGSRQ